ncbi:alanine--tRNA ligase [Spiroplasma endosymbiont of Nebria brevicollis]|uniref:alanine--tRNA ligase n=1 Tax=Spiroplasma endosymbiont of Nebria brevicollis TaxID=3066284 RepID=UPI00313ECF65
MSTKWTTDKVRTTWLDFFKNYDHHVLASASLVPNDDPSLLWINSGVATLKPYFDGRSTPVANRLVNSQKAIRTNDIENIGITARHQTFFEMLGNFSIGDYFKVEAITWGWEFLTSKKWLNLDPNLLYVTVFSEDHETYDLWLNIIKLPKDHIIKGTRDTNFWDMGQGPCGPNTEIYYDRGIKYDEKNIGIKLLQDDMENDRYIEIWNIVFSQFNNDGKNNYSDLLRRNIDTGAGLERLVTILQDVPTNFDTDLFQNIIHNCEKLTNIRYDINNYFTNQPQQKTINTAFKIIADHIRCLVFAISDGVFPSSKDRGYVLRRLIRRAVVYGQKLGINEPFLFKLVPVIVKVMGVHYYELHDKIDLVTTIIKNEELKFWATLSTGKQLLLQVIKTQKKVDAVSAFKLFDTYGYPIELTLEMAQEMHATVDLKGFEKLLENSKDNTRKVRSYHQALTIQSSLLTNLKVDSTFIGYTHDQTKTNINFMFKDEKKVTKLTNETGFLILKETPFYAEKGGQAADDGFIKGINSSAYVSDVQQGPQKQHIHQVTVTGTLTTTDIVVAEIDSNHRLDTRKNHSGTHLLHAALRKVLGQHVMQSGSFNNYQYLRLDFSHYENITPEQQAQIETQVATWIKSKTKCEVIHCAYDEAIKLGALAFFGEKYDETVRVIKFGDFSIELCGGTHCHNTKEVEQLLITNIESKGSGSYRVHALTSYQTINEYLSKQLLTIQTESANWFNQYQNLKNNTNQDLTIESIAKTISKLQPCIIDWRNGKLLINELQSLFKKWQINNQELQRTMVLKQHLNLVPVFKGQYQLLIANFNGLDVKTLRELMEHYRNQYQNIIIIFINKNNEQESLILVASSKELHSNKQYHSNVILQKILKAYDGKGGGTPILGQGKINKTVTDNDIMKFL